MLAFALNWRLTFVASRSKLAMKGPSCSGGGRMRWAGRLGLQAVAESCDGFNFRLWCKIICMNHLDSLEELKSLFASNNFPWSEWFPIFRVPQDTSSLLSGGFRSMSLVDGMVFNALIAWNVRSSGSKPSRPWRCTDGSSPLGSTWLPGFDPVSRRWRLQASLRSARLGNLGLKMGCTPKLLV